MSTVPTDMPDITPPAVETMADALVTAGEAIKQAAETARDEQVASAVATADAALVVAETAAQHDTVIAAELIKHEESDLCLRNELEQQGLLLSTLVSQVEQLSTQQASLMSAVELMTLAATAPTPPPLETEIPVSSPAAAEPPAPSPAAVDAPLAAESQTQRSRKIRGV